MNKSNSLLAVLGAIIIVLLIAFGIYFTMQKDENRQEEQPDFKQEITTYIENMKNLKNYTVTQTKNTLLAYSTHSYDSSSEVIYQVDLKNHKVFNVQSLQYLDFANNQMYTLLENIQSILEPTEIPTEYIKEEAFHCNYFDATYTVEKVGDNYKLIFNKDEFIKFMEKLGNTIQLQNTILNSYDVLVRTENKNIKTIEVSYEIAGDGYDGPYTRKEQLTFEYTNQNNTKLPNDAQEIYDVVKEVVAKKETDTIIKTLDNQEHTIDVTYHFETYGSSLIAVAELQYDHQKLRNYKYMMNLDFIKTLDDLKNYKVQELTRLFSQNNLYTIQGEKEQFLAIYSNYFSEIGTFSDVIVLNGKGKSVIKLEDKINMGIEPLKTFQPHGYTKVNKDSITFYAYRRKDNTNINEGITIHEYKATFGDTVKFESIKVYPGIMPSGDGNYFNDIIS